MRLLFKLLIFILPQILYGQELIRNGKDFTINSSGETASCFGIPQFWEDVDNGTCLAENGYCRLLHRFSTDNCFFDCGEPCSVLNIGPPTIGDQCVPSVVNWVTQKTSASILGNSETFIGLPYNNIGGFNCYRTGIKQKLLKPLATNRTYRLSFDAVFKNDITEYSGAEITIQFDDNSNEVDPEIEEIFDILDTGGINNESWQPIVFEFTPNDCNIDYIKLLRKSGTTGGIILIDNISLKSICAEENRCDLTKFNEDNSNVWSNNIHSATEPLTFNGLAGVELATLLVYRNNTLVSNRSFFRPLNQIFWDGKDNDGVDLPNSNYNYKLLIYTSCDCGFEKEDEFEKTGNMNMPYPILLNQVQSLNSYISIGNLSNVHSLSFKIENLNGSSVYESPIFSNPPEVFNWNGIIGNNGSLSAANYILKLKATNNCGTTEYDFQIEVIDDVSIQNFPASTFVNAPVPKPTSFECSLTNYFPAAFAPLPCCSTDVNLEYSNVFIAGNQQFIAQNNIVLGDNVVILPNSELDFLANNQVIINPGVTIDGSSSYVVLENQNCNPQRIGIINDLENDLLDKESKSNIAEIIEYLIEIFPNPAQNNFTIGASENISQFSIYDLSGKLILKQENVGLNKTEVSANNLQAGIYFVNIVTKNQNETKKLMIAK